MKKRIKFLPILALSVILANAISLPVKADFEERFYKLNDIIYYDAGEDCAPGGGGGGGSTNLEGNDNIEKVWNFLKSKGLSDEQVAGIMGGMWGENGGTMDPTTVQSGQAFDEAKARSPISNYALGIVQWDGDGNSSSRRGLLLDFAKEKGKSWDDLGLQLEFLWQELEGSEKAAGDAIKASSSVNDVVTHWVVGYERPREDLRAGRIAEGNQVAADLIAKFGGKGGSSNSNRSAGGGSKITFIGDSITVGVQDKLSSTFNGSNVSATVGDSIAAATSKLPSEINDTVVVNLGTNDNFDEGAAEALIGKLKGKKIYWVNNFSKGGNADYEVINQKLSAFASKHSEVSILDWKSYAEKNGGRNLYAADGIHPNAEGQEAYVKFLQEAIANGGSNSSSSSSSGSCSSSGGGGGTFMTSADASHTTSDGFSVFEQCDPRWANEQWGNNPGNTMCAAACGPTAVSTMVLALTGKSISPLDMAKKAAQQGYEAPLGTNMQVVKMVEDYGLKQSTLENSVNAVEDTLKKGGLVLVAGQGDGPFLGVSHYVVIRKSEGGKWYTANPGRKELDETPYDPSYVMSMVFATFGVTK